MFKHKRLNERITEVQLEQRRLHRAYTVLLDERSSLSREIHRTLTTELASFRAAAERAQTDTIKFGVLEEWIKDVFELNNLKFSDKDFIEKSEEATLREKIIGELNASVKSSGVNTEELADILVKVIRK